MHKCDKISFKSNKLRYINIFIDVYVARVFKCRISKSADRITSTL